MLKFFAKMYMTAVIFCFFVLLAVVAIWSGADGLMEFLQSHWLSVLFWTHIPVVSILAKAIRDQKAMSKDVG